MSHLLSKSKYIRGLQCDRALWLDVHNPRLARYTAEQMRRFDRGRDFEYSFKATFPQGIDISAELKRNVDAYPERTAALLDQSDDMVLFEAGFRYDDVLVLADVVKQNADGTLDVFEVKSGTILSETYRRDAALQHYVISHCREVRSFSIVHATDPSDKSDLSDKSDPATSPFKVVDLTAELAAAHDETAAHIAAMKQIILATAEPDTPTGQHCLEPYACPYQHYCQSGIRQLALF